MEAVLSCIEIVKQTVPTNANAVYRNEGNKFANYCQWQTNMLYSSPGEIRHGFCRFFAVWLSYFTVMISMKMKMNAWTHK